MRIHCFLLLLVSVLAGCVRKTVLTEEEVVAVIRKFDDGWKRKDLQLVDAVLAPSYIYFTQSGGIFSREGVVKTAGSPEYTLDTVRRSAIVVQLYENTAVVSTRWEGKGIYRGVPFDEDQRCSMVIVKTGKKVSILSEHCTPVINSGKFH